MFSWKLVEFAITQQSDFNFGEEEEANETKVEPEKPQVKITVIDVEEPRPTPSIAHGKLLDDFGNVIGTF